MDSPTADQVKAARKAAKLTQEKAAKLVNATLRSWQKWEGNEREMHAAFWELFLIKSGQHEKYGKIGALPHKSQEVH
ncbi:MAG: helix-turn-helix domain-containing protein [Deferribacteraceae bacterium]|jgi:DNA (cytosine-5)-methyltransferase 1|nr:helix-turn-helix domain-containing protein [Deferribacteraceae bacterium]